MKKKVAEFISFTGDGGVESLVKEYALMLDSSKYEVIIITLQRNTEASVDRILRENNIKIISLYKRIYANNSIIAKIIRKVNNIWYIPYMVNRVIKKEKIDILHFHLGILRYLFPIKKSLKKVRLFYTCHSDPKIFFCPHEKKAVSFFVKECDLTIIALHNKMKNQINKLLNISNTIVVNNGINFDRFKHLSITKEQCKQRLGICKDFFVVGNIGRFVESKNHHYLIEIFKLICEKRKDAFLLLVGTGELKQAIIDKLKYYGLSDKYLILENRSDIPEIINSMDVYIFPTLYEGFPMTMIEVQIVGIRCLATNTITSDAFLTDNTISMSLNDAPQKWCDTALDTSIKGTHKGNIYNYSMGETIEKVEHLYGNE